MQRCSNCNLIIFYLILQNYLQEGSHAEAILALEDKGKLVVIWSPLLPIFHPPAVGGEAFRQALKLCHSNTAGSDFEHI